MSSQSNSSCDAGSGFVVDTTTIRRDHGISQDVVDVGQTGVPPHGSWAAAVWDPGHSLGVAELRFHLPWGLGDPPDQPTWVSKKRFFVDKYEFSRPDHGGNWEGVVFIWVLSPGSDEPVTVRLVRHRSGHGEDVYRHDATGLTSEHPAMLALLVCEFATSET